MDLAIENSSGFSFIIQTQELFVFNSLSNS